MRILHLTCLLLGAPQSQAQKISIKLAPAAVLLLERKPFTAAGKAFKYYNSKEHRNLSRPLVASNGSPFFGTDGEMPRYVLAGAVLLINNQRYRLPVDGMYNPWFGEGAGSYPTKESFRLAKTKAGYRLRGMFSDGAGGYEAEWQLSGRAARRVVLTTDDAYFF